MKYKIIAAAAAVLASAGVQAQSSVTLYGVADVGIEYLNKTGNDYGVVRMSSGNMSGSRWGLRGQEDLGGGLRAIFTLESGFALDTGAASDRNRLFNRQAFLGLQGGFGTVSLGRHETPLYDFSLTYDPMAIAGRYSILNQDAGMGSHSDNSIKYTGTFGGLKVSALYSFGYDSTSTVTAVNPVTGQTAVFAGPGYGEIPGNYKQGKEYTLALNYATGPFGVGAVYDLLQPTADSKMQRASVAGSYAFGPAKAYAGYRWAHFTATGFTGTRSNLYWLGLGYQVTPQLTLTGAAYYQDVAKTKADPWLFVASADYALSKRTDMYLNLAYAVNKTDNGQGVASAMSLSDLGIVAGKNQFGAVVGVRHKF